MDLARRVLRRTRKGGRVDRAPMEPATIARDDGAAIRCPSCGGRREAQFVDAKGRKTWQLTCKDKGCPKGTQEVPYLPGESIAGCLCAVEEG